MTHMASAVDLAVVTGGAGRRWTFEGVVFDERSLELTVSGTLVDIERKPLEVLRFLLVHAGEVVTKDEMLAAVWPGRVLSDTALTKCVARLREVLGESGQSAIKTVHGYGYRLVAPVTVNVTRRQPKGRFEFNAGDHPNQRPLWSLIRRLGAGSHGEAWLVKHDKTREQRVFKFALDENSLVSLKREITLYRLLQESVGDRARIVKIRDWNLEQVPYFVEAEYAKGGSLVEWAERLGGAGAIPMSVRIELVAQIADSLSVIHAVGVLHKDLKPSNILVENDSAAEPSILLGDLGSGGLLDPRRLEALGITRLGFTQTVSSMGGGSGTPLYLAPELLAGQPPTVLSDIFALGVLLYQLVVGDLHRPLSAGWEREIDDELIRADIAHAAEGLVEHRLDSAGELARRLRSLVGRREELKKEAELRQLAARQQLAIERAGARRAAVISAICILALGTIVSSYLFFEARAESATAQSVAGFLSEEMFLGVTDRPLRDLEVSELLVAASDRLTRRLAGSPAAKAQIDASLGIALVHVEEWPKALPHLRSAMSFYESTDGQGAGSVLKVAQHLALAEGQGGSISAFPRLDEIVQEGARRLGEDHPDVLKLRRNLAQIRMGLGQLSTALIEFEKILELARSADVRDQELIGYTEMLLGQGQTRLGRFLEGEASLKAAVSALKGALSEHNIAIAWALQLHALAAIELGSLDEAERELIEARMIAERWSKQDGLGSHLSSVDFARGQLKLRQHDFKAAHDLFQTVIAINAKFPAQIDQTVEPRTGLVRAYIGLNNLSAAYEQASLAVALAQRDFSATDPDTIKALLALGRVLISQRQYEDARGVLANVSSEGLAALGNDHPMQGELHHLRALVAAAQRSHTATAELGEALRIYRLRYGDKDGRVTQAEEEFKLAVEQEAT